MAPILPEGWSWYDKANSVAYFLRYGRKLLRMWFDGRWVPVNEISEGTYTLPS